ncbi:tyrosine-type recombinase/integrase, partial [Sinomonas humi]
DEIGCDDPRLADEEELGDWSEGFRIWLRDRVVSWGPQKGKALGAAQRRAAMTALEQLYRFMYDEHSAARRALGEHAWPKLTPHHAVLFRFGDKPTGRRAPSPEMVLSDSTVSRIVEGCKILELATGEGGFGDEQLSRILKLLIKTGRRLNEICMLDYNPLIAVPFPDPQGHVARLRYQQTKIETDDATILVDQEVVDLIREQQSFALGFMASDNRRGTEPKYLFLGEQMNRNGDRPYPDQTARAHLVELSKRLGLKDEAGNEVVLSRTHMFRHTKATDLLNSGVPIHVGMRYMGHKSANMFMHYAQTLSKTHEAEFLRYRKITTDGREYQQDPHEM